MVGSPRTFQSEFGAFTLGCRVRSSWGVGSQKSLCMLLISKQDAQIRLNYEHEFLYGQSLLEYRGYSLGKVLGNMCYGLD